MSTPIRNIVIEGIDRLGKDTLIEGVLQRFGYFQPVHFQKPRLLDYYLRRARIDLGRSDNSLDDEVKKFALQEYQVASFLQMFHMLSGAGRYILNRAHLGEFVYSSRYRKYDGSYVFDLEQRFKNDHGSDFADATLLILLQTSDFSFISDDGQSFDVEQRDEEQNDFVRAFERSIIKNKMMIDVSCGGTFVDKSKILEVVQLAVNTIHLNNPVWNVEWYLDEKNEVTRRMSMQSDARNAVSIS